jgi:uncharacterized protein (DUF362 family)
LARHPSLWLKGLVIIATQDSWFMGPVSPISSSIAKFHSSISIETNSSKQSSRQTIPVFGHLWLPRTVLASDFSVSMPKVKTHHWTGVTLSMKNMFGIVPGSRYGWPKNVLHWAGIHESILDICATVRPNFVIADGIIGMDGDGPLNGAAKRMNSILLSDDPVAADFMLARLLGYEPNNVKHLCDADRFIRNHQGIFL